MLSKALVPEVAEDTYVSTPTEFITGKKCDVLYAPSNPLSSFPPYWLRYKISRYQILGPFHPVLYPHIRVLQQTPYHCDIWDCKYYGIFTEQVCK